jgi:hypothetical protein
VQQHCRSLAERTIAGEITSIDKETFHFLWYDGQAEETMNDRDSCRC